MLIYDDLTLFIISSIYEAHLKKDKITTWDIAKKRDWSDKPFNPNSKEAWSFYQKKSMLIIQRLKCMAKEGYLIIEKVNGSYEFTLIKDRLQFRQKYKFPCGFRKAILINKLDDKWVIYQA